jgi:hypothetical protein
MRIKRKNKSRIHKTDVQSESEDFNDSVDFSAARLSKSVYHHGNNANFSKTIFEVNCKSKPQVKNPTNRRNKTLTECKKFRFTIDVKNQKKEQKVRDQEIPAYVTLKQNSSQLFQGTQNQTTVSRNWGSAMSMRNKPKQIGLKRKSNAFMKNMHLDYYKSLNNVFNFSLTIIA